MKKILIIFLIVLSLSSFGQSFTVTITSTPESCPCMHDGSATATPSDTCPSGYHYLWSTSQTTQTITGLDGGMYSVTVACDTVAVSGSVIVGIGDHCISCSIDSIQNETNGQSNGSLKVDATGGSMPYSYYWSNGKTTAKITNLCAGTYIVTATSACGCSCIDTAIVLNLTSVNDMTNENNISCFPNPTNGALSIDISNLNQSDYTLELSDFTGRLVYSDKINSSADKMRTIDISRLAKGVYNLRLCNKNSNFIRKIFKE